MNIFNKTCKDSSFFKCDVLRKMYTYMLLKYVLR